jgi:hypothetical protein
MEGLGYWAGHNALAHLLTTGCKDQTIAFNVSKQKLPKPLPNKLGTAQKSTVN